jgi:Ni,Fe-hydrogenase III large subunit
MMFPLGPLHPALPEPWSLRLALRGETVTRVDAEWGYAGRGIEDLLTRRSLDDALDTIEHLCGLGGHSHRLALCLALESFAKVAPPPRAAVLRTIFSEVERVQARLWLLMQVARCGEFGALFTAAVEAREMLAEACENATEQRMFWGVPLPGGARDIADPLALIAALGEMEPSIIAIERMVGERGPLARRTTRVGLVPIMTSQEHDLTGLVARGAGSDEDVRVATPYDAYRGLEVEATQNVAVIHQGNGDLASRLRLAVAETRLSIRLIASLLDDLPEGQLAATFPVVLNPGVAKARIESPHGREEIALQIGESGGKPVDTSEPGWLTKIELLLPSDALVALVPEFLVKQRLSDVPLILASLDLCMACVDR